MHGSIQDRLEDLLAAKGNAGDDRAVEAHLATCRRCASEIEEMKVQNTLLQTLRAPDNVEPEPGFYARVLQRIEERAKDSIWSTFIYSPFTKRLTYASLAAALALGSYVIGQETLDGHLTGDGVVAQQRLHSEAPVVGSLEQQREAVLVNFVSHQGLAQ